MGKLLFVMSVVVLLIMLAMTAPAPAVAQQDSADAHTMGPPPVLSIIKEEVKIGKGPLHEKSESAWAAAYKKANLKYYYLGTTAMSGGTDAVFFSGFASMEDAEKATAALAANKAVQGEVDRISVSDGDLLTGGKTMYAFYNADVTYRPNFNVGEYKYFMMETYRIKPGHMEKFEALRKAVNAAHEKAGMDEHMVVYNVGLGAPGGTVLVFQPLKSLRDYDAFPKTHGKGSAYYEATGDEGRKAMVDFAANDIQYFQRDLLAISPQMSVMSEQVMAANPSFWQPKTAMAKTTTGKTTPAAKKEKMTKGATTEKKKN